MTTKIFRVGVADSPAMCGDRGYVIMFRFHVDIVADSIEAAVAKGREALLNKIVEQTSKYNIPSYLKGASINVAFLIAEGEE